MRRPPETQLPQPRGWPRSVIAVSVAAHAVLLVVALHNHWIPRLVLPRDATIALVPLPPAGTAPTPVVRPSVQHRTTLAVPSAGHAIEPTAPAAPLPAPTVSAPPPPAADTGTAMAGAQRIGPGLARGKLWVEPLPLPPKELAQRLQRTNAQLADSAVSATIQAFLDSIAADPASKAAMLPSWTTTVAGKKFGIDGRNIYVAGLKIPAAVLALLHLPPGNESKAFDRSGWLYEDLRVAAQRSANMADFKREIGEIRERTEAERQFQRNQRTAPPKENEQ